MSDDAKRLDKLEREVKTHQDSPSDATMLWLIGLARDGLRWRAAVEHGRGLIEEARGALEKE